MINTRSRTRAVIFVLLTLALLLLASTHFRKRHDEPRLEPLESVGVPVAPDGPKPSIKPAPESATEIKHGSSAMLRVPCLGPRGLNLAEENDDTLRESVVDNLPYPRPFLGSHETLALAQTWMTAADRYGPYGWGDDQPVPDAKRKALWHEIDWDALQNQCLAYNAHRFKHATPIRPGERRFHMRAPAEEIKRPTVKAQAEADYAPRTAIVFRAWEGYNYTKEDLVNLRATITETALRFGGDYTVFILIDVKDHRRGIFSSNESYLRAMKELVPPEFRNIAILFDETLLQSWYPRIKTHGSTYQIMQPLQLFSYFYPEFDFYWQLELDIRFTGHTGRYLAALSDFARVQPRKQAMERSTWYYMPQFHGSYSDLLVAVNASLKGKGGLGWDGSIRIQDLEPIGPKPPVKDPVDDNFEWGVGEEADFIGLTPCAYMPFLEHWVWRKWQQGFKAGTEIPPGWMCQPAMGRASGTLLGGVHYAQAVQGLAVHSEATLSSFALWYGLKLVVPPQPIYQDPQWPRDKMNELFNGPGAVEAHRRHGMVGMARGDAIYRQTPYEYVTTTSASFWYTSSFPDKIYDAWLGRRGRQGGNTGHKVPHVLWRSTDGRVYAPNMMLHPVKTNQNMPLDSSGDKPWPVIGGVGVSLLGLSIAGWWWKRRSRSSIYAPLWQKSLGN